LYLFFGTAVGFVGGITNFLPVFKIDIYPVGNFTIPLYCLIVTYAIIRYRLMDIRIFITHTAAFLLVYPFLLGIPFFFGYRMYPVLYPRLGMHWWVVPSGLLLFFAIIAPAAYRQVRKKIEDALLADQKRYQKLLLQAASGMVSERSLSHLARLIVYITKRVIKLDFAAIFLAEGEQQVYRLKAIRSNDPGNFEINFSYTHPIIGYLKDNQEPVLFEELPLDLRNSLDFPLPLNLIIPSIVDQNLLGFVILGEKSNHQPYTEDDINVFRTLSRQAALAISYCLFLEEFKNAQEKIFNADKQGLIGGMADGVAHQIRNRLNQFSISGGELEAETENFIKNNSGLLAQYPELKKTFNYYLEISRSIIGNVKHTSSIVNGMLNFAQELEQKEIFFSSFHVGEIGSYALDMLKIKHQIMDFPLELQLGTDDIVHGIKPQIMESLYNIIDNSYEATEEKRKYRLNDNEKKTYKPQIRLKVTQNEEYTFIAVSDNGVGIKEEDKPKIFAPFFTTKSSYKSGTGIGIYSVKRMIEEIHNGKIWFESEYLKGTTFYIKLPKETKKGV
jgi:signal transduction histidine kinase